MFFVFGVAVTLQKHINLPCRCAPQGSKVQTRVGLLMLLCTWISNCPIAVTHFLHNQENVPFVSLKQLLRHLSALWFLNASQVIHSAFFVTSLLDLVFELKPLIQTALL